MGKYETDEDRLMKENLKSHATAKEILIRATILKGEGSFKYVFMRMNQN